MVEESDSTFVDNSSRRLMRKKGEVFPWVLFDDDGIALKHFIVRMVPFSFSSIEIDSVAFGLIEKFPQSHSLLVSDVSHGFAELSGVQLLDSIKTGNLKVLPASYRLVFI